jgi:hypothetical protein
MAPGRRMGGTTMAQMCSASVMEHDRGGFGLTLLLLMAASASDAIGQAYYAEGALSIQLHIGSPLSSEAVLPPSLRTFTIHVDGEKWLIRVYNAQTEKILYTEAGSDGKTLFSYTSLPEPAPGSEIVNSGVASIRPDRVPGESGDYIQYIWTALASHEYFRKLSPGQLIKPPWHVSKHEPASVPVEALLSSEPPFLPIRVTYFRPPGVSPFPFEQGWIGAEFRSLSWTNIGGLTLPLEFEYAQYRRAPNAQHAGDIEAQSTISITLTHVEIPADPLHPRPRLHGITLVEDFRFRDRDPPIDRIQYSVTNNYWPEIDDEVAAVVYRMQTGSRQDRRIWPAVLLLLLLVAPVLVFVCRKTTAKTAINT